VATSQSPREGDVVVEFVSTLLLLLLMMMILLLLTKTASEALTCAPHHCRAKANARIDKLPVLLNATQMWRFRQGSLASLG